MARTTTGKIVAAAAAVVLGLAGVKAADNNGTGDAAWYWHERYHGFLSMAAYGDYNTSCQLTFNAENMARNFPESTEAPWTIIQDWGPTRSGLSGFIVIVPEMGKVVTVFKNIVDFQSRFNDSVVSIGPGSALNLNCDGCTAHAGAVQAYIEAREVTNNFELAATYRNTTGKQWSSTGHQFGGMVSQLLCLEHAMYNGPYYCHSHGSPRVFNPRAAAVFNGLLPNLSNQRVVANEDSFPEVYPESENYTHVLTGFHVYGTNPTYGQNQEYCGASDDPACLGGNVANDTWYYYTNPGDCGNATTRNPTLAARVIANYTSQQAALQSAVSSSSSALPSSTSTSIISSTVAASTAPSAIASSQGTGAGHRAFQASGAVWGSAVVAVGALVAGLAIIA